ncbi:hypothetical protein DWG18_03710 [Lysobacter sp. TY2-98]|nr:hypothetical protein DWG18_03710 [Lysobacter sp. TY2-98]
MHGHRLHGWALRHGCPPAEPAWAAAGFWDDSATGYQNGNAVAVGSTTITPRFVIEDFGTTSSGGGAPCPDLSKPCIENTVQRVFRVTSYAKTPNGAEVILQSLYRR